MGLLDRGTEALMKLRRRDISRLVLAPEVSLLEIKPGTDLWEGSRYRGLVVETTPDKTEALTIEFHRGAIWVHEIDFSRYNPDTGKINSGSICTHITQYQGDYDLLRDKLRGLKVC